MENVKLKDENMTTGTEKERLTVSGICKIVYAIWQRDIWILPCERTGELETHPRTRKKDTINLLFSLIEEDKNLEYVEAIESNRATPVFHGTVDIPERIRRKAESCSTELIKSNFKNRIYRYLDENQRKYFWDGIQELVENTNIADDILRLGDFQGVQYESKGKDETVFCLFATSAIIFALSRSNDKWKINESNMYRPTATNILPEDIRQKYDPYTLTGRHSHSSALQFKLIKDGAFAPTVIFYSQEKALGYVRGKNLLITRIEYEPKAIRLCYRDAGAEGYTLRRVESRDINKIYEFVKGSHDEFREKVSWRGRNIEDMTLNGLKKEVWTGYAYFYSNGKPAAYVDYKLRVDSDIEMGVALTDKTSRKKSLSTELINYCRLMFMSQRLFTGTYEENIAMRKTLENCGFTINYFYDKGSKVYTGFVRERIDKTDPQNMLKLTNSVYYYANSLLFGVRCAAEKSNNK